MGSSRYPPLGGCDCKSNLMVCCLGVPASIIGQMAMALTATGWWMLIDVPQTPQAVVVCVVVFNAAFGYRWAFSTIGFVLANVISPAGGQYHGYIHLRYAATSITILAAV